jgi:hypothetical protein
MTWMEMLHQLAERSATGSFVALMLLGLVLGVPVVTFFVWLNSLFDGSRS